MGVPTLSEREDMTALPPVSSRPSTQQDPRSRTYLSATPANRSSDARSYDRPGTGLSFRSNRSTEHDDNKKTGDPDSNLKESMKSLFSTRLPVIKKGRSNSATPNAESTQSERSGSASYYNPSFESLPGDPRYGVQVSITGGTTKPKKSTFAEKAAKFGRETFGSETRPPWKGGSGRTALVEPVKDTSQPRLPGRYTAVKDIPDMSRSESHLSNNSSISESSSKSLESRPTKVRETVASSIYDDPETVEPILPLNIIKKSESLSDMIANRPISSRSSGQSSLSTMADRARERIKEEYGTPRCSTDSNDSTRTVTGNRSHQGSQPTYQPTYQPAHQPIGQHREQAGKSHFSWTTYAETERSISPIDRISSYDQGLYDMSNPESRFSWTTTSTDTTYQKETPPSSPPKASDISIMSRRRPVPGREIVLPKRNESLRKPVPKGRNASTTKELPQPPRIDEDVSNVEKFTAQIDALEVQKTNMQKVMEDMKKVESASPLEVSERQRRENRKKMADIQKRQDDVQREIFEIGRLLTRARKREEEESGKSTGLWLRRVTD